MWRLAAALPFTKRAGTLFRAVEAARRLTLEVSRLFTALPGEALKDRRTPRETRDATPRTISACIAGVACPHPCCTV